MLQRVSISKVKEATRDGDKQLESSITGGKTANTATNRSANTSSHRTKAKQEAGRPATTAPTPSSVLQIPGGGTGGSASGKQATTTGGEVSKETGPDHGVTPPVSPVPLAGIIGKSDTAMAKPAKPPTGTSHRRGTDGTVAIHSRDTRTQAVHTDSQPDSHTHTPGTNTLTGPGKIEAGKDKMATGPVMRSATSTVDGDAEKGVMAVTGVITPTPGRPGERGVIPDSKLLKTDTSVQGTSLNTSSVQGTSVHGVNVQDTSVKPAREGTKAVSPAVSGAGLLAMDKPGGVLDSTQTSGDVRPLTTQPARGEVSPQPGVCEGRGADIGPPLTLTSSNKGEEAVAKPSTVVESVLAGMGTDPVSPAVDKGEGLSVKPPCPLPARPGVEMTPRDPLLPQSPGMPPGCCQSGDQ